MIAHVKWWHRAARRQEDRIARRVETRKGRMALGQVPIITGEERGTRGKVRRQDRRDLHS